MRTLTEKECKQSQLRIANGYGDKWPYKGYNYDKFEHYNLPEGWTYIFITTWGVHIRRVDDTNYMNDLN